MKYKVGDKFLSGGYSRTILGAHMPTKEYWVLDQVGCATYSEAAVNCWIPIKPFFEKGKAYRGRYSRANYEIGLVGEVFGQRFAIATVDGDLVTMTERDYESGDYIRLENE